MRIIYNEKFSNTDYANDSASVPGRMESIIDHLKNNSNYIITTTDAAELEDIERVHKIEYINSIKENPKLYEMALLSSGGAIKASQIAMNSSEATFACIRPPGHHAYVDMGWGYCHFCNMAVALKKLRADGRINSAFVLDFDAHTGDGTINSLADWKEVKILNPMAEKNEEYITLIENVIKDIEYVDIIAVCAGFDSYIKDCGGKLTTFDFYRIGYILKRFAKRLGHNRRFAILEGGYYLPDLGKNVLSFCQGFE